MRYLGFTRSSRVAFKNDLLKTETPRCRLERMGVDLNDAASRERLLADVDARAGRIIVLTEGVVTYLDEAQAAALSDDLRSMSHVDSWIIDYFSPEAHVYREVCLAGRLRCIHGERSSLDQVRAYVLGQEQHHRGTTFQEEYVAMLQRGLVEYDERYLW